MSRHLLFFSVGPVADFVAASRRTRDLHVASWIVSEMARQAARAVVTAHGATLVSPASVANDADPVTDRVLAVLPEEVAPAIARDSAKAAAEKVWLDLADAVLRDHGKAIGVLGAEWQRQRDSDLVEFFAAWVPLESDVAYAKQRARGAELLDAREALTDFRANTGSLTCLKSSLDGRRESVLRRIGDKNKLSDSDKKTVAARGRLGIKRGEEMDLPGVVKRLASGAFTQRFVPVSRIATQPWISGAKSLSRRAQLLKTIRGIIEDPTRGVTGLFGQIPDPRFKDFPYDGELLFPSRVDSLIKEVEDADADQTMVALHKALEDIAAEIKKEIKKSKDIPCPYLAVLSCDGDRIGSLVKDLDMAHNRDFSVRLSTFAAKVVEIVSTHKGSLVYAGGDDVLCFVPLCRALDCAGELYDAFTKIVTGGTLSVGLAIVHTLSPMQGEMIALANQALADAKRAGRDRLAIALHKRSGPPVEVVLPWRSAVAGPAVARVVDLAVPRMKRWVDDLYADRLPVGLAYELRALGSMYREHGSYAQMVWVDANLIQAEVLRILKKKSMSEQDAERFEVEVRDRVQSLDDVEQMAREIVIARTLLEAKRDAQEAVP